MKKDLAFYTRASQNLIAIHHLKGLLTRLQKKGPKILFFRGISLLGDVYPSMGERGMIDVDILVREKDQGKLKKVFKGISMTEIEQGNFDKKGLLIDVHTSFLNPSRTVLEHSCLNISIEDVFKRSITKKLDNIMIRIPCPVHLFLTSAIHFQSHSFVGENGWEDLKRIKNYYRLSDAEILSEATQLGAEQTLAYLSFLRPSLFPSWGKRLSLVERWILQRIMAKTYHQNFGDLLFLFQSKRKVKALQEIFFPQGISCSIIVDRLKKTLLLLRAVLPGSKA
ncbi:MAG: nucleotidyltransferase family protein [Deltaproteobacteria bacterium]|nr:nucleotidyltransferase family protein [Deltaproteobacteria bacterium]